MTELKPLIIGETGWLEATWVDDETQVYCQSYHPTQIDMLRDKAAEYGTPLDEYEQMLADWVYSYVPEPPAPEPPAPHSCTPAQGLVALYALKQLTEQDILNAIAQITDPVQRYTATIGYQRATTWERGSTTMQTMAQLLGLTDADLDELFAYAVGVTV